MNRSIKFSSAMAVIAAAVFSAPLAANAFDSRPVVVPVHQAYGAPVYTTPVYEGRRWGERGGRSGCRAPRWESHVRYMPGDVVRRHGDLWVARRISARVWNENSPPEWTPSYWDRAVCG